MTEVKELIERLETQLAMKALFIDMLYKAYPK